jgi:hypothetical protein
MTDLSKKKLSVQDYKSYSAILANCRGLAEFLYHDQLLDQATHDKIIAMIDLCNRLNKEGLARHFDRYITEKEIQYFINIVNVTDQLMQHALTHHKITQTFVDNFYLLLSDVTHGFSRWIFLK